MTTLEILEAARDRIRDPKYWCKGTSTTPDKGCAMVAVSRVSDLREATGAVYALQDQVPEVVNRNCHSRKCVACFNDTHTHPEVLELFNLAIASELAKQNAPKTCREPVLSGAC